MAAKRLRVDTGASAEGVPASVGVPTTPPQLAAMQHETPNDPVGSARKAGRNGRPTTLSTPEQKVQRILERYGAQSFCDELGIDLIGGGANALWQWFAASVLMSARIKSSAGIYGLSASKEMFAAGATSPRNCCNFNLEDCQRLLRKSGFTRGEDKVALAMQENAGRVMKDFNGDLSRLREVAGRDMEQERSMLKKYRGVGDGGVDIFFREVQLIWDEVYPFADKKALKAARLVGLNEHPHTLASLCSNDRGKYVRLTAALVRIEVAKTFADFS